MKLITFKHRQQTKIGALIDDEVVDASLHPDLADNMLDFLAQGDSALSSLQKLIDSGKGRMPRQQVELLAPVPRPGKFLGISLNYADHIGETGLERPEYPTFFTKQSTCVIGPGQTIRIPMVSEKVDYEGELALVIGKRCKHVSLQQAPGVIAGFTIVNDVSVRDWQIRSPTWMLGKSFDTHGPMGPWLVTADEIPDPHNLRLETWVDDECRQQANTGQMLFDCYEMIAYLSQAMTLEPGDVIATGTPAGVGVKMKPRGYLKAGQTVRINIEKIGQLQNPVDDEKIN